MRRMADSVTPTDIPINDPATGRPWHLVAGYVDGVPRWPANAWNRFPASVHVRIALDPVTNDGHVLDVENGAANPNQAPGWVMRRRAAGADPTVYCNLGIWQTVRDQFAFAGVPEPHWWIAAYPGIGADLYPGTVAHQFADPPASGGHWDLSVVADHWPGVDTGALMDEQSIAAAVWNYQLSRDGQEPARAELYLTYDNSKSGAAQTAAEADGGKLDAVMAKLDELAASVAALKGGQPAGQLPSGVLHVQGDLTVGTAAPAE